MNSNRVWSGGSSEVGKGNLKVKAEENTTLQHYDSWRKMRLVNQKTNYDGIKRLNFNHWNLGRKKGGKERVPKDIIHTVTHMCVQVCVYVI